ncbi:MAG: hypothetical protein GX654_04870 [Desulfatiglans sp.]|jgi:hypothetical protein|nr:hypothetical protein [Desulfatiglans sp.]
MEILNSKAHLVEIFMILFWSSISLLLITGGSGFIGGDLFFYSFIAFLVSIIPVFTLKGVIRKPAVLLITDKPLFSRKKVIQYNDPLLIYDVASGR